MKTLVAVLASLVLVFAAAGQTKPGANPAPVGKAGAKKDEPPGKIDGMEISRGARGFMGLQIVNGTFKLSFYDAKKKPAAPDVTSAALRWNPPYKKGPERVVLTAGGDGKSLASPQVIRPPYTFKLFITLLKDDPGGAEPVGETFVVDFTQ